MAMSKSHSTPTTHNLSATMARKQASTPKKTATSQSSPSQSESSSQNPDLYAEFNVKRDASTAEIVKAFRKLALRYHPDRLGAADPEAIQRATERFQQIALWYEVLADPDRREIYDATGVVDVRSASDAFGDRGGMSWSQYFDSIFQRLSVERIEKFRATYEGSDEQLSDIKNSYKARRGNVFHMLEDLFFFEVNDLPDLFKRCQALVKSGDLPTFRNADVFDENRYRKMLADAAKEERAATKMAAELTKNKSKRTAEGDVDENDDGNTTKKQKTNEDTLEALKAQIMLSKKKREETFFASLEAKYGGETKKKSKKNVPKEPTEEEFAALQKKLFSK